METNKSGFSDVARASSSDARSLTAKARQSNDPKDHELAANAHDKAYDDHEEAHTNADNLITENSEEAHSAAMDYHEHMAKLHREKSNR